MVTPESDTSVQQQLPIRAGGGRPTTVSEYQKVKSFSPVLQGHFKKIYNTLTAYSKTGSSAENYPPLTSLPEFEAWFETPIASALAPPPKHDLSYPISNYYISSSHNTYLSGNQLYGSASGDAYRNVLIRGCRCLEIDVWDGADDDSSVSSSDYEDYQQAQGGDDKSEGKRDRSSSRLTRFTHRVKDKASRMRSPGRSPGPSPNLRHNSGAGDYQTQTQAQSLGVPTMHELKALKAEPRVYHGYTLTKDIPFRVVCRAINDSAFEATDLPLIVSLEVHCSLEQQEVMVDILQEVFKEHLVEAPDAADPTINKLPSPDQLRRKILIKVKWSPNQESGDSNDPLEQIQSNETEVSGTAANPEKKKKAAKILQKLSDLGVYTRAYSFKQFNQPEARLATHVFSLSEAKVEDCHADPQLGLALFEHNRDFLMRVFPSGMRVDSSNVEPCFLWRQGAQMVALNWQKLDKGTMLNEGMFAGEEGWVLKPEGFRSLRTPHTNAITPHTEPKRCILDLEVEIIAAQNLPLPLGKEPSHFAKMKPYIKFQLHVDTHGPPGHQSGHKSNSHGQTASKYRPHLSRHRSDEDVDEDELALKRKSRQSRGPDPDFGCESVVWKGIHDVVDELSFLRLKINDDRIGKDDLIAWACIKLSRLRLGYRLLHLLDATGSPCDGALLLRINKTLHG